MARPIPLGVTGCGVVGKAGFEPAISRSRTGRDTRLRYFPTVLNFLLDQRAFTCRSTYNASCFLRNKFSAASWVLDRTVAETNRRRSQAMRRTVSSAARERDCAMVAESDAMQP